MATVAAEPSPCVPVIGHVIDQDCKEADINNEASVVGESVVNDLQNGHVSVQTTTDSSQTSESTTNSGRASATGYPRYQSPTVTLLQKKRDGTIPKGAVYMLGLMSYDELMNKKNRSDDVVDSAPESKAKIADQQVPDKNDDKKPPKTSAPGRQLQDGQTPTKSRCVDAVEMTSSVVVDRCEYFEHGGPVMSANRNKATIGQPNRIEDYEPGHSSLSVNNRFENRFHNPPVEKPGEHCKYKDNSSGLEYKIRRLGPMSPTHSNATVHELYRRIQNGGIIPQHGLQLSPAENRRAHSSTLAEQLQRMQIESAVVNSSNVIPKTRQQRDLENAVRRLRLERAVAEEKRKRLAQQQLENLARRHSDFYTPFQNAPVSLYRYDDEVNKYGGETNHRRNRPSSTASRPRGKARALYTFRAQTSRELSFRKGDYLYLLRQIDKNWFYGERHGLRGIFPITYVEVIVSLDEAQDLAAEREGLGRALYNFVPQTSSELQLKKGDVVKLVRAVDENWYEGYIGSRRGIFPANYIETLVEPDPGLMTPMTSRTVTPMPGPLSPCGSTVSQSIAPTIPSAPLSPADSELFDETQFSPIRSVSRQAPISHAQANNSPVAVSIKSPFPEELRSSFADDIKNLARAYSWLDEQTSSYRVVRTKDSGSGGATANFIGSATWSPQSATVQFPGECDLKPSLTKTTNSYSYTQLRYPPYRVLYSYQPRNADELELRAGDIVYVVEMCDDGWYVGTCERTQDFGTFPGNYVQKMR